MIHFRFLIQIRAEKNKILFEPSTNKKMIVEVVGEFILFLLFGVKKRENESGLDFCLLFITGAAFRWKSRERKRCPESELTVKGYSNATNPGNRLPLSIKLDLKKLVPRFSA